MAVNSQGYSNPELLADFIRNPLLSDSLILLFGGN